MATKKPPLGDIRLLDLMNVTTTQFAEWIVGLTGPIAARELAERLTTVAEQKELAEIDGAAGE